MAKRSTTQHRPDSDREGRSGRRISGGAIGERVLVVALFGIAFSWGLWRIRMGLNMSDEGLYLSAPLRYALGDLPFRDEFLNPHRMFDVLLWPLFAYFPDLSVYSLRLGWLVLQTIAAISLHGVFRRFAPAIVSALACAATLYVDNLIWTPGYHGMGTLFFVLSWSIWHRACLSDEPWVSIALGAASGGIFLLGAISYLPLLALETIPGVLALALVVRTNLRPSVGRASAAHVVVFLLGVNAYVLWIAASGLLPDWLVAHATILASKQYDTTLLEKVSILVDGITPQLVVFAGASLLVSGLLLACNDRGRIGRLAATPAGVAVLSVLSVIVGFWLLHGVDVTHPEMRPTLPLPYYFRPLSVVMFVLGLHLAALFVPRPTRAGDVDADWWFVYATTTAAASILTFLHAFLSGMPFKAMFALLPLFVPALVLFWRRLRDLEADSFGVMRATALACSIGLVVGLADYTARRTRPYGDMTFDSITDSFRHPLLDGIYSAPGRVHQLEAVAAYLESRVREGDYLLVSGNAPILYYLTRTRPALDHTWSTPKIADIVLRASVEKMKAAGRIPAYAVRSLRKGGRESPIDGFVRRRYELEWSLGQFEIWRLREARGGEAGSSLR